MAGASYSPATTLMIFLLPSLISIQSSPEEILSWQRYWIVLSLSLLLDSVIGGRVRNPIKIVFLAWCLLPGDYNGTDAMFGLLVRPVLHAGEHLLDLCVPVVLPVLEFLVDGTIAVLTSVADMTLNLSCLWIQKILPPINCATNNIFMKKMY